MTNEIEAEAAVMIALPRSKVNAAYKRKYADREAAMTRRPKGVSRKVLARSSGDWLAVELAKRVLNEKDKLVIDRFYAILTANGIDATRWAHLNPGQQRMCGGLALRAVVANNECLLLEDDTQVVPPRTWIAAHQR